jgi:hypothetical protein
MFVVKAIVECPNTSVTRRHLNWSRPRFLEFRVGLQPGTATMLGGCGLKSIDNFEDLRKQRANWLYLERADDKLFAGHQATQVTGRKKAQS